MSATATTPRECDRCAGPTGVTATVSLGTAKAEVFTCRRCGHKDGKLTAARTDPPDAVAFVRRKLNQLLGVKRPRKARAR